MRAGQAKTMVTLLSLLSVYSFPTLAILAATTFVMGTGDFGAWVFKLVSLP